MFKDLKWISRQTHNKPGVHEKLRYLKNIENVIKLKTNNNIVTFYGTN